MKAADTGVYASAVSTHSRPKAAGFEKFNGIPLPFVSTHSRPKAAGPACTFPLPFTICFNTQPPEGGWPEYQENIKVPAGFNTQPPEGGWFTFIGRRYNNTQFQHTAARRRLDVPHHQKYRRLSFQHTAARRRLGAGVRLRLLEHEVSTHSRPKAAGRCVAIGDSAGYRFNTQPPEGGWYL